MFLTRRPTPRLLPLMLALGCVLHVCAGAEPRGSAHGSAVFYATYQSAKLHDASLAKADQAQAAVLLANLAMGKPAPTRKW